MGSLPGTCAILTNLTTQTEMMAVEGFFQGDAMLIYQAIAHDLLTAAKLSLAEIKKTVMDMFQKRKDYLSQFRQINI